MTTEYRIRPFISTPSTRNQSKLSLLGVAILIFSAPLNPAFADALFDLARLSAGNLISPLRDIGGSAIKRYVPLPGLPDPMVVVLQRPNIVRTQYLSPPRYGEEHYCYLTAVTRMLNTPGTRVVFPSNLTLNIKNPTTCARSDSAHWVLRNLLDVEIDLNKSTLIFHENRPGISFGRSTRVRIANGTIKYGYQTTSIAQVKREGNAYFFKPLSRWVNGIRTGRYSRTVETVGLVKTIDSGSSSATFRVATDEQFVSMHPKDDVYGWDQQKERFYPKKPINFKFNEGNFVYIAHAANGGTAIALAGSTDIEIEFMKFHNIQGNVIAGYIRRGLRVANSQITPDPENNTSQFGTTAAGIHLASLEGDVIIERNIIESTGDDAINLHGGMWRILNIVRLNQGPWLNETWIQVGPPDKRKTRNELASAGDPFAFFDGRFNYKASAIASSNSAPVDSGENPRYRFSFSGQIPASVNVGDYLANAKTAGRRVIISSNLIQYVRPRGIMTRTSGTYIVNNQVYNTTDSGIRVGVEMRNWWEGLLPVHVRIVRNRLANNARSYGARMFGHKPLEVLYLQEGGHPVYNNRVGNQVKYRLQRFLDIQP